MKNLLQQDSWHPQALQGGQLHHMYPEIKDQ